MAFLLAVVGLSIAFPLTRAQAACSTAGTPPTVSFTCAQNTTTDGNNINTTSPKSTSDAVQQFNANITATINSGVVVNGDGLLLLGSDGGNAVSVTNNGTIKADAVGSFSALGLSSINTNSTAATYSLKNSGIISGTATGANGIDSTIGLSLSIVNSGTIAGQNIGIFTLLNTDPSLTIKSNTGSISGGAAGILADTANITNSAGGSIAGSAAGSVGINATNLTLTNSGTVSGTVAAITTTNASITNTSDGVISGVVFDKGSGSTIFNAGRINGAIEFTADGDTLTLAPGSVITGAVAANGAHNVLQLGGSSGSDSFNLSNLGSSGQYIGFSTFNKLDNSTWTLTGTDSGNNAWNVQGGTLLVDGATRGAMTVQSGAFLGGNGVVGTTTVANGGTLMPGHGGIGELIVNGNLAFASGAAYQIAVNGPTAGFTGVFGNANLNNASAIVGFLGGTFSSHYTILAAGNLSGTFSSLFTNSAVITANLSYTTNDVMLNLTSNIGGGGGGGGTGTGTGTGSGGGGGTGGGGTSGGGGGNGGLSGLTRNQQAVANALNNACNVGGTCLAGIANVSAAQVPAALDALSGEGVSATQQAAFAAGDMFLSMMMDQGAFWRSSVPGGSNGGISGAPLGYAAQNVPAPFNGNAFNTNAYNANASAMPVKASPFEPRWRGWVGGFDGTSLLRGQADPGSADQRNNLAGAVGGVEYLFSPDLLAGVAVGGSSSSFSVPDRSTSGSLTGGHLGAYTVARFSPWYVAGAVQYSHFDNNTSRSILGVGPNETAVGSFGSDLFSGRVEVGWQYALMPGFAVTPFAAIQAAQLRQRSFDETSFGPNGTFGANALGFASERVSSLPTFLGAEFDARYALGNGMILSSFSRLSWVHEFDPARNVTASFLALADSTFTVDGPRATPDAARIDLGAELKVDPRTAFFANFNGEFSDRSQFYAGKGGVRVNW